jgi:hypothetical protein
MSTVDVTASRLRHAVASGSYDEAREHLQRYVTQVVELSKNLSPENPRNRQLLVEAKDVLDWAHRIVSAARAHTSTQFTQLLAALSYRTPNSTKQPTWYLEG